MRRHSETKPPRFNLWRRTGCVLALAAASLGCSKLPSPKTIDDAASTACEVLAQEKAKQAQTEGVSIADVQKAVKEACDAKDELQPWIDALLATKQEQDAVMGARMGVPRSE